MSQFDPYPAHHVEDLPSPGLARIGIGGTHGRGGDKPLPVEDVLADLVGVSAHEYFHQAPQLAIAPGMFITPL